MVHEYNIYLEIANSNCSVLSVHNHVILFCDIFLLLPVSSISYLQYLVPHYKMLSSYEKICDRNEF